MDGLGTDDESLIRLAISRSEIDIKKIRNEYRKKYNQTLGDAIRDDTTGFGRVNFLMVSHRYSNYHQ